MEEDGEAEQHDEDLEPEEGRHLHALLHLAAALGRLLGLAVLARGLRVGARAHEHAADGRVALLARHRGRQRARVDVLGQLGQSLGVLLLPALLHDLRPAHEVQVQEQQVVHAGGRAGGAGEWSAGSRALLAGLVTSSLATKVTVMRHKTDSIDCRQGVSNLENFVHRVTLVISSSGNFITSCPDISIILTSFQNSLSVHENYTEHVGQ